MKKDRRPARTLEENLDYLFVINLFNRGGAEVETLHMIRVLLARDPGRRVGVLTTLGERSEWLHRLPREVVTLEFGYLTARLGRARQCRLLGRLLREARPRVIHVVGCQLGWDVYRDHAEELSRHSVLLGTSFGSERYARGGYIHACRALRASGRHIRLVLSDNRTHTRELREELGFERTRALHMPVTEPLRKPRGRVRVAGQLRVLWASRWCSQKRLDVLYRIALFAPEHEFHVYGSVIGPSGPLLVDLGALRELPNVTIHGPFDGSGEIPFHLYDVFLYTSIWDGLPNILLETAARGLPIIAPDVGGVRELVSSRTGFLVSKTDAVSEYLRALERIRREPALAARRALRAQELLKRQHGWSDFDRRYRRILKEIGQ